MDAAIGLGRAGGVLMGKILLSSSIAAAARPAIFAPEAIGVGEPEQDACLGDVLLIGERRTGCGLAFLGEARKRLREICGHGRLIAGLVPIRFRELDHFRHRRPAR